MVKQRMRRGERPREGDARVLRAGDIDGPTLRGDAEKNFDIYGFYGLSVWIPGDDAEFDGLLTVTLKAASEVTQFLAADLYERGLELWDTGQYPHYDGVHLVADSLDALVDAFLTSPRTVILNRHYDPEGGRDR